MKIYVVTNGEYSDYHIIVATADKTLAEKAAKRFDANVEEFDDSEINKRLDCKQFFIRADKDFNISGFQEHKIDEYDLFTEPDIVWNKFSKEYRMVVYAETAEKALEIAHDMLAKKKAEMEGL